MRRWHVRCLLVGMTSNDRIVALTVAQERISPVFDVAQTALIIEQAKSGELRRTLLDLSGLTLEDRLVRLKNRGVNELVCGAMSKPALALAIEAFSEVHAFVAGDLETVTRGVDATASLRTLLAAGGAGAALVEARLPDVEQRTAAIVASGVAGGATTGVVG